ncbi:MAG: hypothetical protein AAF682_31825 [Planctomycetota bacterium]
MADELTTLLEYGTFGRLSALAAPLEYHEDFARDQYGPRHEQNSPSGEELRKAIFRGRTQLIDYLINVVETIVLAERVVCTGRIGTEPVLSSPGHQRWAFLDVNCDRVLHEPDIARRLWERFEALLPIEPVPIPDDRLRDAWYVLERTFLSKTDFLSFGLVGDDGTLSRENMLLAVEHDEDAATIHTAERDGDLIDLVTRTLGPDFAGFRSELSERVATFPSGMMRSNVGWRAISEAPTLEAGEEVRVRLGRFMMEVEAYAFSRLVASLASGILPTWSLRPSMDAIGRVAAHVARASMDALDRAIDAAMSGSGFVAVPARIPELLRACLVGAKTVDDVLDNAARLRETKWAQDYRKYLRDVVRDDRPAFLARKLARLEGFLEDKVSGHTPLQATSLSVSVTGSGSLGLKGLGAMIARRRNAAFVYHSHLSGMGQDSDALGALSSTTSVPREHLARAIAAGPLSGGAGGRRGG